ncbi:MoaD/ThiS family protein [Phenylobacterium sp.]|uniref:MoaD/ThiS family protein n=1 Tax=Phenylobacterium sp. TaxID=1871053 RepID=UPI002720DEEB|nr:MoaD/ThiS family protein [Phenylobacterium sp.]MDO8378341.1 MoaD/ThiS family protein [Phenylobacterium sp.]
MAKVLLFGRLSDIAGWRERSLDPLPATLAALRAQLCAEDAGLAEALAAPGVQVALDQVLVRGDAALTPRSEIAFLPAMSGG